MQLIFCLAVVMLAVVLVLLGVDFALICGWRLDRRGRHPFLGVERRRHHNHGRRMTSTRFGGYTLGMERRMATHQRRGAQRRRRALD